MTKRLLNLDEFLPEETVITLGGKDYVVSAQSTRSWLEFMRKREELEALSNAKGGDRAALDAVSANIAVIKIVCPDVPEEELFELPLQALMRLSEVIAKEMMGGMSRASGTGTETGSQDETPEGEAEAASQ